VVAVLTGNGLKDPQTAMSQVEVRPAVLPATEEAVTDYLSNVIHV